MIRSMTGFGQAQGETVRGRTLVSARSLNHRFLDLNVRLAQRFLALEPGIRSLVQERVRRGRVELSLQTAADDEPQRLSLSHSLARSVVEALRALKAEHGLSGDVSVSDLLHVRGLVELADGGEPLDPELRAQALSLVARALDELNTMRLAEGRNLAEVVRAQLEKIERQAETLEAMWSSERAARTQGLTQRLQELRADLGRDDPRLYQEIVRSVDRSDIAEETARLRSHVDQARAAVDSAEACGKRLDFLAQEMLREANTLGSKVLGVGMARETVDLKAEIERLREQVQNIE
jgi:uncharacterized protein (TIGR00255 family)